MQKKLIALAIAGLSGAAFAQSNVTIYGVMDLTQESAKADGATAANAGTIAAPVGNITSRGRLSSNSSLIGFKGSESLGGGLTAVFQYESAIAGDASGALAGGRDTYIGVAGGFGTVAAGTLTHPVRVLGAKVDNNPGASSSGFTGSMYGEMLGVKTGSDERATNAVAYISPTVSGFHGVVAYVNLERAAEAAQNAATTAVNGKAWQIAGVYDQGPLFVGFAWDKHTDPGVAGTVYGAATMAAAPAAATAGNYNDSLTITRLAATYSLPSDTKLSVLWDKQKYDVTGNAALNTDATRTAFMLGANQKFGASNVWLQYAVAKDPTGSICNPGGIVCGDYGAKQVTLGYSYTMSKRTMVHALFTKITNDKSVAYDHYVNGVGLTAANNAGADTTVYGLGVRHSF